LKYAEVFRSALLGDKKNRAEPMEYSVSRRVIVRCDVINLQYSNVYNYLLLANAPCSRNTTDHRGCFLAAIVSVRAAPKCEPVGLGLRALQEGFAPSGMRDRNRAARYPLMTQAHHASVLIIDRTQDWAADLSARLAPLNVKVHVVGTRQAALLLAKAKK